MAENVFAMGFIYIDIHISVHTTLVLMRRNEGTRKLESKGLGRKSRISLKDRIHRTPKHKWHKNFPV